jgi:hypothetical protein
MEMEQQPTAQARAEPWAAGRRAEAKDLSDTIAIVLAITIAALFVSVLLNTIAFPRAVYGGAGRAFLNSLLYVLIRLGRQTDPDRPGQNHHIHLDELPHFPCYHPFCLLLSCSWGNSPGQALFVTLVLPWRIL